MLTEKRKGTRKSGAIKKGYKVSKSGPQAVGHGAVPINIVKVPKVAKLKPMSMTYGGSKASAPATKRVRRAKV